MGFDALIRIRLGSFQFTNELVRKSKLPGAYKDKCICCGLTVVENPEHMMLKCAAFNNIREGLKSKDYKLDYLLGGGSPASGGKPTAVLDSIKYLAVTVRRRAALIAAIQRVNL